MDTPRVVDAPWPAGEPFAAYVVVYSDPVPMNGDVHQGFEVGVLLRGEELRRFNEVTMSVDPGDAWLIPPWEPHAWEVRAPDTHELVLHFLPGFVGEEEFGGVPWLALFSVPPEQRPRVTDEPMRRQVVGIAGELAHDLESKPIAWLDSMRLNLLRLLLTMRQHWSPVGDTEMLTRLRVSELARVMPAVRLVQSTPAHRVSLAEAAHECGMSVELFRTLFRRLMGLSFGKFSLRARLAHAAHLLRSSDLTIETIASETGFADASHLHRMFAKLYGRAPGRYREDATAPDPHAARDGAHIAARLVDDRGQPL